MTSSRAYRPLADYGFLGDCHNWALVADDGSIDWCCFEVNEGRSIFARILDREVGGHCTIRPAEGGSGEQRYLDDTNVLCTRFTTDSGTLEVTDALALREDESGRGAVDARPYMQLLRRIACTDGEVEVAMEVAPRFEYGLTSAHVRREDHDNTWSVLGGEDALRLWTDLEVTDTTWTAANGTEVLAEGDVRWLSIEYRRAEFPSPDPVDADVLRSRMAETVGFWEAWVDRCDWSGRWRDQVVRSALVLKALTDARTGGIAAAPTTSLPEEVGGERNYDYRYVWMRDASTMLDALYDLGYETEAQDFVDWLARTTAGSVLDLQVMYTLDGGRMLQEVELPELEGYRGSRPVRIGNRAAQQFQLDVYGEVIETLWRFHEAGGELAEETVHLLEDVPDRLAQVWQRPDAGIWEQRGNMEQFTSSKVYAWVAADRLVRFHDEGVIDIDRDRTEQLRDRIRTSVEHYGVDVETGAVLRAYGQDQIDAANLLPALLGFWEPDDDRVTATLDRVLDELTEGELVYRYRDIDDGLTGGEGAFLWSSFWVVELLARRGQVDEAVERFEALLDRCSPLGLLSEECDPDTGELLGNYPQAISHVGLIQAAVAIEAATA